MKSTPLNQVKESHGDKAKLVASVQKLATDKLLLARETDGGRGLERLSNSKLLRLHGILSEVKKEFGSRDALITAILKQEKRAKDSGYKQRLERYPTPRLLDHYKASRRQAKVEARA